MNKAKSLTITYLTKASYASLNGSDKEVDNISSIKKIRKMMVKSILIVLLKLLGAFKEQLSVMGMNYLKEWSEKKKSAATTKCDPQTYIDDDLFGFMNASTTNTIKGQVQ